MAVTPPPAPTALPLADPQFWIVTLAALGAGLWILWRMIPKSLFAKHRRARGKRATLTVGGKAVDAKTKTKPKTKPKTKCH